MNQASGAVQINNLLVQMNREGDFPVSVLADSQGLPISWAAREEIDPERQSAVVAMVQKAALQAARQLGMQSTDEIMFSDSSGHGVVCRIFEADGLSMILAVILPDREHAYRRATNRAVNEIRRIGRQFWS
jgi:predicted regulator of Ras-like GTPase activity (Roadblock/LC7/MglB family)